MKLNQLRPSLQANFIRHFSIIVPVFLLTSRTSASQKLSPNPAWSSLTTTSLVKQTTAVQLMRGREIPRMLFLQGVKVAIRSQPLAQRKPNPSARHCHELNKKTLSLRN